MLIDAVEVVAALQHRTSLVEIRCQLDTAKVADTAGCEEQFL